MDLLSFCSVLCLLCLCARLFYMCFVVTCWERANLLALVCEFCHFPLGILGQVWYLIVSIPDLCTLTLVRLHSTNALVFVAFNPYPVNIFVL